MTHGNEAEGTEKAQIRKTEFLALGERPKAIILTGFWLN